MKRLLTLSLVLLSSLSMVAQNKIWQLKFEITQAIDAERMRARIQASGMEDQARDFAMPTAVTIKQTIDYSENLVSLGEARPEIPAMARQFMKDFKMPASMRKVVDVPRKVFIDILKDLRDSTAQPVYYTEEAYKATPADWKSSKKTKTILGYECTKATCTLDEQEYTLWVTTQLPGTFCPINGLMPPVGVVLGIESDERAYELKSIEEITTQPEGLPKDALQLDSKAFQEKRKSIFSQFGRPGGGGMMMRTN